MEIKLSREEKLELLRACQNGVLDTDKIVALKEVLDLAKPARILTKAEMKELFSELEREY